MTREKTSRVMKLKCREELSSGQDAEMRSEERRRLQDSIHQWNIHQPSLFEISEPDEDLIFHGVIRFHLQDHTSENTATKCIRISSTSTAQDVIETLLEKFQPDKNLQAFPYFLYEVFGNEDGRRLDLSEKPLIIQLNWAKDNTDGRFILRNSCVTLQNTCLENMEKVGIIQNFKRTFSRKEKTKKQKIKEASSSDTIKEEVKNKINSITHDDLELKWNLPLSIILEEKDEDSFLLAVINGINSSTIHFKLSPAYVFYLLGRFLITQFKERNKTHQRTEQKVCMIFDKIVHLIQDVIQKQRNIIVALAFWMANTSELLNFIRQDRDLSPITLQAQNTLALLVQQAFRYLSHRLQVDLEKHLPAFFTDVNEAGHAKEIEGTLNTLIKTMNVVRRCRVNPALSIQLISQLFHFMSAWLLNRLTGAPSGSMLCSHYWGKMLQQRLRLVEAWAERQGLELAVDCHLSRVIQATMLLTMNRLSTRDAQTIQSTCYKLNSLQLRALITKYHYAPNQSHFPPGLTEKVVTLAETTTDVLRADGGEIHLEEDLDLHLPFLLPEEGYSCDAMRGIPQGFQEFLEPICCKGLCKLIPHPNCVGEWTIFFDTSECQTKVSTWKAEPMTITLKKPVHGGMGVSIVSAKGAGQEKLGIFIKSVVQGGAANVDGRLESGDQLLSVNGNNLVGVSQERAAEIMFHTGSVVTLEIVKLAAVYYGLEGIFTQPPPTTCKDHDKGGESTQKPSVSDLCDIQTLSVSYPSRSTETFRNHHAVSRAHKTNNNQRWLKQKLEYRSNPNLAYDQEIPADSATPVKMPLSFSTDNLILSGEPRNAPPNITETYQREYQTLPVPKPQSNKTPRITEQSQTTATFRHVEKKNFMARSENNLWTIEKGGPLVDRPKFSKKPQDPSRCTHFGIINSVDSSKCMGHKNDLWKVPMAVQYMPLSQPKRLDVPFSPQDSSSSFSTFRTPVASALGTQLISSHHHYQNQNKLSLESQTMTSQRPQQQRLLERKTVTFHPSIPTSHNNIKHRSPPKHVSVEQQGHTRANKTSKPYRGDLGKRTAQETMTTDLLQHEVQQLQNKVQRTLEESERLRRLSLELQFQKRLEEFQLNDDEDGDEEDDRTWVKAGSDVVDKKSEQLLSKNEIQDAQQKDCFSKEDSLKDGVLEEPTGRTNKAPFEIFTTGELEHKSFKTLRAPENLTFKERQQLFSLAMINSSKVKVS